MTPLAVIFDWAGTLIDPGCCAPVIAFQRAFAAEGIDLSDLLVRRDMGLGKREHTQRLLSEPDVINKFRVQHGRLPEESDVERLYVSSCDGMLEAALQVCDPIAGAADAMAELKARGVRIGSTTGYPRAIMNALIPRAAAYGITPEIVVCAEEVPDPRPRAGQIRACLARLGIEEASRCVKVDDTVAGLQAGRAAGCVTVAVTRSGNPLALPDVEQFADTTCESVAGLNAALERM